jgi:hypothetical protein
MTRNLLALASFAALAAGFWLAWPPLGLIVPGGIVFAALAWSHVRRDDDAA